MATKPPATLTFDQIVGTKLPTEIVEVEEWGGAVKMRGLSKGEMKELYGRWPEAGENEEHQAGLERDLIRLSMVEPALSEDEVAKLDGQRFSPVALLVASALRLSGLGAEEETPSANQFPAK